jgi:hypothetical protein
MAHDELRFSYSGICKKVCNFGFGPADFVAFLAKEQNATGISAPLFCMAGEFFDYLLTDPRRFIDTKNPAHLLGSFFVGKNTFKNFPEL